MEFDDAAERLCRASQGVETGFDGDNLAALVRGLDAILRQRLLGADQATVEDVAQDALERFIRASGTGRVDCTRAGRYLSRIASNAAVDVGRRTKTDPIPDADVILQELEASDEVARFEHRNAISAAMRDMLADGKVTCVKVVACWEELAEGPGAPSSRELALELGVSHTTVLDCLNEFEPYLRHHLPNRSSDA